MLVTLTTTAGPSRGTTIVASCVDGEVAVNSGACYSREQAIANLRDRVRQYRARIPVVTTETLEVEID